MQKQRMEKISRIAYGLSENVILIIAMITVCVLTVFNFIYNASVIYGIGELVTITRTSPVYVVLAILGILVFVILSDKIGALQERDVFRFFAVLYLIAGAYWILNISTTLRADAWHIQNAARLASQGDFSFLELGQDIRNHPWQLGMVTYERILGLFSQNVQLLFLVNLLAILGINYFSYRLADLVFEHDHKTNLLTILLSFLFLPQFFFLAFAYGLTPGFFCLLGAFYFQQKFFAGHKIHQLVICILLAVCATILKGNYTVGVIAMAILFLMRTMRDLRIRYLGMAVLLMFGVWISQPLIRAAYEWESGMELNEGEPKLLYVAMGILPENRGMAPGWYCGYNDYTFGNANFDPDAASEMAKESIAESLAHYVEDPADAVEFFSGKIASVWCEPMYQSLWSGPLEEANQTVNTRILASLYHGATLEKLVSGFMKGFLIMLLVLAVCYVFDRRNRKYDFGYGLLYVIGGFLLHIVWEGKSQYVYPYIFILIPGCARELAVIGERVRVRLDARKRQEERVEGD